MTRYLMFAYDSYYPRGGWGDLIAYFDDIQDWSEAYEKVREGRHYDYVQVISLHTMDEVWYQ